MTVESRSCFLTADSDYSSDAFCRQRHREDPVGRAADYPSSTTTSMSESGMGISE